MIKVMSYTRRLVTATVFSISLVSSVHANLVLDGGFESPIAGTGTYLPFNVGQSFNNWTVIGTPGQSAAVAIVDGAFVEPPTSYPAQEGNQWLDLTGVGVNGPNGVQQSVATTLGGKYQLSFWVGNVSGLDRGPISSIEAYVDGISLGTFTNADPGNVLSWLQFTQEFTANGASTLLSFVNRDPTSDHLNGLDNVALVRMAVPEPPAYSILLLALGLMGLSRRRAQ